MSRVNNLRERRRKRQGNPAFNGRGSSGGGALPGPAFNLPFTDLGLGQVSLVLAAGSGSGTFTRATTATTILSNGLIGSVASGVPRSCYSLAGVYLGYLAEGARTNLCLRSEELDNAAWTASNITVVADAVAAPDGATTADTLTADAGNGTLLQAFTIASAVKVFSIWLKRKTGTGNIDLTLDSGSTWTTQTVTASWNLYQVTQTLANPTAGIRIVTSGDAVWAWGGQLEAASFSSSYIPTTSAAVTRNADLLTYPQAGNYSTAVGTIFVQYSLAYGVNPNNPTSIGVGNASLGLGAFSGGFGKLLSTDSTTTLQITTPIAFGGTAKAAVAFSGSTRAGILNGVTGSAAFDGSMGSGTTIGIGMDTLDTANFSLFGTVASVKLFSRALTNAEMAAL